MNSPLVGIRGYLDGPRDARGGYRAAFNPKARFGPEHLNREPMPRNSKWCYRDKNSMRGPTGV